MSFVDTGQESIPSPPQPAEPLMADLVQAVFAGGGQMGGLMRSADWSSTALGEPSNWSPALRMMVKFLLANRFPQLLWWGPQFCSLYNDAYIPILGEKHPWALGQPVREVWKEIWHVLKPLIETPFLGGPATWMEDIPLEINRRGFFEETHFTIAYSPVPDETVSGGIGGVLATVHEITDKVIGERRVHALRELGARDAEPKSTQEACATVARALSSFSKDVPFLLLYLLDEKQSTASLACQVGIEKGDRGCPDSIELRTGSEEIWPFSRAGANEEITLVENLPSRFDVVPQGPWADSPTMAAVVPIRSNMQHQLAGFMIAGLSSRIHFDDRYRDFLDLLSTQIATMIANARALEHERKRAESLAELDRAKTLFFSNISHELAGEAVHRNKELLDVALAASGTGTFRWSPRTDVVEIDQSLKRLFELEPQEPFATLEDLIRRVHGDDVARLSFAIDACRAGADLEIEFRISLPGGNLRWLSCRAKMQYEGGRPACLVGACTDVTARKAAEESLRESELWLTGQKQAFQAAVDGAPLSESLDLLVRTAIKHFRGEARCAFYLANASGTELQLVTGMPEDYAKCVDGFKAGPDSLASGLAVHTGQPRITADVCEDPLWEPWLWLAEQFDYRGCWSFPVTTSTGKAIGTLAMYFREPRQATSRDLQLAHVLTNAASIIISRNQEAEERARTEQVLRENEQRMRIAHEAAGIGTFEWNLQTRENHWSPEIEAMYGLAPGTFSGTQDEWEQLLYPEDRPAVFQEHAIALQTGAPVQAEWRTVWPDGSIHWILGRWQVIKDESGTPVRLAGINIDVTGRKLAEEARRHLAAIVESSDDAIVSKDLTGIVKSWNRQAERLFGYSAEEMIGQSILKIVPPELQDDEDRILATIARGEGIEHLETVRLAKSGQRIEVSLTISPIRDENGRIVGASKIARDITQRKQTEQALRITERLASVGRLAATVAHEINNPLEAATNLVYLARCTNDAAQIPSLLTQAEQELKRVGIISRQTLGFYRERNGAKPLRLGSIVESLIVVFSRKAQNKSTEIQWEIRQDPEIFAIEGEVRQLIANLLNNSIDAIVGSGRIRIRISAGHARDRSRGVRLTIADSGHGIAAQNRSRLFEPFFTTNKEVGTGLGLWISRSIVQKHQGCIRFKSRTIPGKSGSAFSVFLPSRPELH